MKLTDGRTLTVDDEICGIGILYPADRVVAGYQPLMPTFCS